MFKKSLKLLLETGMAVCSMQGIDTGQVCSRICNFQAVSTINTLLEKADRLYRQLRQSSTPLATYLARISEHSADKLHVHTAFISSHFN